MDQLADMETPRSGVVSTVGSPAKRMRTESGDAAGSGAVPGSDSDTQSYLTRDQATYFAGSVAGTLQSQAARLAMVEEKSTDLRSGTSSALNQNAAALGHTQQVAESQFAAMDLRFQQVISALEGQAVGQNRIQEILLQQQARVSALEHSVANCAIPPPPGVGVAAPNHVPAGHGFVAGAAVQPRATGFSVAERPVPERTRNPAVVQKKYSYDNGGTLLSETRALKSELVARGVTNSLSAWQMMQDHFSGLALVNHMRISAVHAPSNNREADFCIQLHQTEAEQACGVSLGVSGDSLFSALESFALPLARMPKNPSVVRTFRAEALNAVATNVGYTTGRLELHTTFQQSPEVARFFKICCEALGAKFEEYTARTVVASSSLRDILDEIGSYATHLDRNLTVAQKAQCSAEAAAGKPQGGSQHSVNGGGKEGPADPALRPQCRYCGQRHRWSESGCYANPSHTHHGSWLARRDGSKKAGGDVKDGPTPGVCRLWKFTGECKYGANCKFEHPEDQKGSKESQHSAAGESFPEEVDILTGMPVGLAGNSECFSSLCRSGDGKPEDGGAAALPAVVEMEIM